MILYWIGACLWSIWVWSIQIQLSLGLLPSCCFHLDGIKFDKIYNLFDTIFYGPMHTQTLIQWGSKIWPFEILKHMKSGRFEGQISNGWALAMSKAIVPTIWNRTIWNLDVFIPISNVFWQNCGHLSGFQIPLEILTICNPTSFRPFKILTCLDFRSHFSCFGC